MKKHILITGGAGYIGSHIAKALTLDGGYTVTIVDRNKGVNVAEYCSAYIRQDFNSKVVRDAIASDPPDVIVHCAGSIQVGESVINPSLYYHNNVEKTISFLSYLVTLKNVPAVIFSSSASVYGNTNTSLPISESTGFAPINPYGHTKAMVEQALTDFSTAYGLKSVSLRYFNACGADPYNYALGQSLSASHIIAKLIESKLTNKEFTLFGTDFSTPDGTCIRDYVHVWDLATAHIQAINYILGDNPSVSLNLGTNVGASNRQVIDCVESIAGKLNIINGARRPGDPEALVADASRANSILGWVPQYSTLPVIVDSAWKWYTNVRI